MKKSTLPWSLIFIISLTALFSACKKNEDPAPAVLTATTYTNLAADPPTGHDNTTGAPIGIKNKFTFFSFKTGAIVSNADSASSKWDIGFKATTIIVNNGTSGPGNGGAIVQTGIFSEVLTAPTLGYLLDDNTNAASPYAIKKGSDNGWYHYDGATNVISPIAGRVLIIRTADAKYAKVEILSFYKDAPAAPTSSSPDSFYTFRYVYQADGSTKLQ